MVFDPETDAANRTRFLVTLYRATSGDETKYVRIGDIAAELGFTDEYAERVLQYLRGEKHAEPRTFGGYIGITHIGIRAAEELVRQEEGRSSDPCGQVTLPWPTRVWHEFGRLPLWEKIGVVGAVASIIALLITLTPPLKPLLWGGPATQTGEIQVESTGDREVFYPRPFKSPPELTWVARDGSPTLSSFEIVEQRADGFVIRFQFYSGGWTRTLGWRARGVLE